MNKDLYSAFKKYNIDTFGVTDASLYNEHMNTQYSSIICALFPYYCGESENSRLSIYTHGRDYHKVIQKILVGAAEDIGLKSYKVHADIGPAIERRLAVQCGLCFRGRNSMCINDKYGSYFFIGYIACFEKFEFSKPNTGSCLNCGKCVSACPCGALDDGFDKSKCLSEITQKKGGLSEREKKLICENGCIFGCDICQKVCPHNQSVCFSEIDDFVNDRIFDLNPDELKGMSNREFKEKYGDRAFAWRGKNVLIRNLEILGSKHEK